MAENNAENNEGQEKGSSPGQNVPRQEAAKMRLIIWTGLLEWHEIQQGLKIPRQVPCQVSANVVAGEPDVKGDGWPPKLIMQLIPKAIVGTIGSGGYFRDVKTVLFMFQNCDTVASLTRVMDSGYAGCVHFIGTSMQANCAIKVLILLYSKERHAYLGFIPNDQAGFVDRIRKVVQQQKTHQAVMRQGQEPTFSLGQPGGPNMGTGRPNIFQFIQQPHPTNIPNMPFGNEQQSMLQQMLQHNLQQAGAQPQLQQPEQQQQQQQLQQQQQQLQQQQQHIAASASPGLLPNIQQAQQRSPLLTQLQQPIQPALPNPSPQQPTPPQSALPQPGGNAATAKERHIIWTGLLEWHEKQQGPPERQKIPRQVSCKVSSNVVAGEPEVKGDGWPPKLIMQLIPKAIVGSLGGRYFRDVKTVLFMLQNCDALASLTRVMDSGFAGCVHFTGTSMQANCAIKVLILLYSTERHTYLGFIPNDQAGFVDRIRKVIQQQKIHQAVMRQGQGPTFPIGQPGVGDLAK